MSSPILALVVNGFREARRNRVTVVLVAFAAVLVLSSSAVADAAIVTMDRVLVDVALGSASVLLVALAVFLSCAALSQEIQRRTIFIVMSKPISRSAFLLARFGSILLTVCVLELVMLALFFVELFVFRTPFQLAQVAAFGMLFVEIIVITALGVLMSTFSGPIVSAVVVGGTYFAGHQSRDIYERASRAASPLVRVIGRAAYYLVPNLERLDFKPHAAYGLPVNGREFMSSLVYGLAYAALVLCLAMAVFRRRDFK